MRTSRARRVLTAVALGASAWTVACEDEGFTRPSCGYVVSPASAQFDNRGGTGALSIQTMGGCAWTVANNDAWIQISGERSGSGPAIVNYTVAANPDPANRTAAFAIADKTVTVTQSGVVVPNCSFVVEPTSGAFGPAGGSASVGVTAPADCQWTASSNVSWIGISSGGNGTGGGSVTYVVAANTSAGSRIGTLTVAGRTVTVSQVGMGNTCMYTVAPTSASFTAAGGTGTISVAVQTGCGWGAFANSSWISITSGSPGSGSGTVQYAVAANTATESRSGVILVAGHSFGITQAGTSAAPSGHRR